jgi:uncharacterized membrane protein YGL010W
MPRLMIDCLCPSCSFRLPLGAFHQHKLNQLIHIVFVPLIAWSAMVFFILATPGTNHALVEIDSKNPFAFLLPEHGVNFSLIIFLAYAVYYLTLDFWPAVRGQTHVCQWMEERSACLLQRPDASHVLVNPGVSVRAPGVL